MSWNPIPGQVNVLSASIVAKADGSPIIAGTVNAYVIADTGANAGKWFKTSDNSWSATEAVSGVCAFKGGSVWEVSVDAECWTAGIEYSAYYVESGGLNVIGSPDRYRCEYPQDLLRIGSVVQSLADLKDFADSGYDPSTHTILADLRYAIGAILTETAGAGKVAGAVSMLFDVVTPALKASDAMRGTDGANTVAPATPANVTAAVASIKGADGDTLKTLSDQIDGIGGSMGAGAASVTVTLHDDHGAPIADADVWITNDAAGLNVVAGTLQTNSLGSVTFMLDAGVTYYRFAQKDGFMFSNPTSFVAVAD